MCAPLRAAGRSTALRSDPDRQQPIHLPLKVQPVLAWQLYQRRPATSWRPWGGLFTEREVEQEVERITTELCDMTHEAACPLDVLPLRTVQTAEDAAKIADAGGDVVITYAAGGSGRVLETLAGGSRWNLLFVRHRSGPVYVWYEIAHPRFLRKTVDAWGQPGMDVDDVVVDRTDELALRLRALYALKNTLGKRIVAVGGPGGWGAGGRQAPARAREVWRLDIQTVSYDELGQRIRRARSDAGRVKRCRDEAERYLAQKDVSLETGRPFVLNAFLLCDVFRDLMDEAKTDAITINQCMSTIMPIGETTACLPLSLLNDEGYMAFCESDFVVIPSGILLHYISGKPVFLNDPTYPHDGVVTLAHCTAPRKMNGVRAEPVRLLTHFESDYGAAPKVEMRTGEMTTNVVPDFAVKKWTGFEGEIVGHPFYAICRSQIDVAIQGDTRRLLQEMRGFHWMTVYGRRLKETVYALKKAGVEWADIT